jgi:predicted outer membrane protein
MRILTTILLTAATGTTLALSPQGTPTDPTKRDPQPPTQVQPGQDRLGQGTTMRQGDVLLATWLAVGSDNEIALSQLAVQRSTNPEVKAFAQKMIDDHRQMLSKLRTHAPGFTARSGDLQPPGEARAKERPAGETDPNRRDPATDPTRRDPATDPTGRDTTGRTDPAGRDATSRDVGGSIDTIALVQDLGRECLQSAKRELESKSGAEFDKCYVGMAIGEHMKANDMMTVFQRHASSELRTAIADDQRTVKAHLDHAKELMKKLEGATSTPGR